MTGTAHRYGSPVRPTGTAHCHGHSCVQCGVHCPAAGWAMHSHCAPWGVLATVQSGPRAAFLYRPPWTHEMHTMLVPSRSRPLELALKHALYLPSLHPPTHNARVGRKCSSPHMRAAQCAGSGVHKQRKAGIRTAEMAGLEGPNNTAIRCPLWVRPDEGAERRGLTQRHSKQSSCFLGHLPATCLLQARQLDVLRTLGRMGQGYKSR